MCHAFSVHTVNIKLRCFTDAKHTRKATLQEFCWKNERQKAPKKRLRQFVACNFQSWIILGPGMGTSQSCELLITVPAFWEHLECASGPKCKNGCIPAYKMKLTRQNAKDFDFYCAVKPQSALKHNIVRANMALMYTVTIKQITEPCFC